MPLINLSSKGSGGERLLRSIALLAIFAIVGWAFWANNERTIERLNKSGSIWDQTGTLTEKDKDFFYSFASGLKDQFGMRFKLQIRNRDLEVPSLDSKTLFIGVVPSRKSAVVVVPVIMERALGREFTEYLDRAHFRRYWDGKGWVIGLKDAVVRIWERLTALEAGHEPPPIPGTEPEVDSGIESGANTGRTIEIETEVIETRPTDAAPEHPDVRTAPQPEKRVEPTPEATPKPTPAPAPEPEIPRGALNS